MKKKMITLLLAGTLATMLLTGCGMEEGEGEGKEPIKQTEATATPVPTVAPTETPIPTIPPVITLGEYKGVTLYEVSSEEVSEELEAIMESFAELAAVERAAVEGDTVNINYVGKMDGVAFAGGTDDSEEGTNLELGSGQFIDGFESGLVGAVAGEVRDLNLTFPENYGNAELAGQAVVFTVTVNSVMEEVIPELTDDFVSANLGYSSAAELITELYKRMNTDSYCEQIQEMLMESSQVENYPEDRIQSEKNNMIDSYTYYAEMYAMYMGTDAETALATFFGIPSFEALEEYAEETAYDTIKNLLIFNEIAKIEGLELTDETYAERALVLANSNGYEDVATFEADYGKEEISEVILMHMALEFVIENATLVEAESHYDQIE